MHIITWKFIFFNVKFQAISIPVMFYFYQVAEFSIGLFFACLFTFQLFPILVTIAPALVRASVLILIHPQLQVENSDLSNLRMTILQRVIQVWALNRRVLLKKGGCGTRYPFRTGGACSLGGLAL